MFKPQVKKIVFYAACVLLNLAVFEFLSSPTLLFLEEKRGIAYAPLFPLNEKSKEALRVLFERPTYLVPDESLGWTIAPGAATLDRLAHSNSQGIRAGKSYFAAPPAGKTRIAAFGDSFTHCDEVSNSETWPSYLEELSSDLEVINFGVPGYGTDQAFLKYRKTGAAFKPDIVFIGVMSENLSRLTNVFRPFYFADTQLPFAKPRFILNKDSLSLIPNPLPDISGYQKLLSDDREIWELLRKNDPYAKSGYARGPFDTFAAVRLVKVAKREILKRDLNVLDSEGKYNTRREAYQLLVKLIDAFYSEVEKQGAVPVLLIFPQRADVIDRLHKNNVQYSPLVQYAESKRYRYIDLSNAYFPAVKTDQDADAFFGAWHNNKNGNKAIADYIYSWLESGKAGGLKGSGGAA